MVVTAKELLEQYLKKARQESEARSEKIKDYLTEGKTYVQRDLEDQIEEEYEKKGIEYQRTQVKFNNMSITSAQTTPTIVVQDVLNLLKQGYTRYTKDDEGYGNIQAHYQLTGVQVKELFSHPKLKARKTILPRTSLLIVDNEEGDSTYVSLPAVEEVSVVLMDRGEFVPPSVGVLDQLTAKMEAAVAPSQDVLVNDDEEVKKNQIFS